MLRKFLTSFTGAGAAPPRARGNPIEDALLKQVVEARAQDPLIGARVAARELLRRLGNIFTQDQGVHAESLFCALGALGGYACQAAVRAQATARGVAPASLLTAERGADGHTYYSGNALHALLDGTPNGLWPLISESARTLRFELLPDIREIFRHVDSTVGTPAFGKPRSAGPRAPRDLPFLYLRTHWTAFHPTVMKFCSAPEQWPMVYGFAIREALERYRQQMEPGAAATLAMECADAMSRIDLATHGQPAEPVRRPARAATLAPL
ncbi:hypothetical protein [Massilia endophytica]|uniref:hypothetical protein n=1 Tax=Massilia endophytica TaxID=2899220 RepID=UPI001E44BF5A|nr:hypothetical protein [Massilia endophytica]UGQ45916.1 hypothetical protein LSQ66_19325 [Massilia endophytica]